MATSFYRLIGGLLLLASVLKIQQFIDTPVMGPTALATHVWGMLQSQFEIALGSILISGIAARWNRGLVVATFLMLAGVSGYQAVQGAESCGCFGNVSVDPLWVFLLDLAIVALALSPLTGPPSNVPPARKTASVRAAFFLALLCGGALVASGSMRRWESVRLSLFDQNRGGITERFNRPFFAIEPDALLDRNFRIADYLSEGQSLQTGNWIVLFHRPECPQCEAVLRSVAKRGLSYFRAPADARLCLVDMSGAHQALNRYPELAALQPGVLESTLNPEYRWVVRTPLAVYVANQVVVACADSENLGDDL